MSMAMVAIAETEPSGPHGIILSLGYHYQIPHRMANEDPTPTRFFIIEPAIREEDRRRQKEIEEDEVR